MAIEPSRQQLESCNLNLATPRPWHVPGRIAYIVSHSYPYSSNGYAVRTHGVATGLRHHGHSVIVINRPGRPWDISGFNGPDVPFHQDIDGVRYLYLREPSRRTLAPDVWQAAATEALQATLRLFKPSVVMAASNWETAQPALQAARALSLPFFYEVRGFWEITRASREPDWAGSAEYQQVVERETAIAQQADRVFTLNSLMRDELVRRGVPAERIELVPNGVGELPDLASPPALTREALGIKSRYVVGYVGSFNPYEGLEDLIRAGAQLVRGGMDLSVLLVGSGSVSGVLNGACSEAQGYRQLGRALGLGDRLALPGWVSSDEVADYYRLIDLVVIPRKSLPVTELVSPIKPLEAAAHGKALLLSDVAPLAECAVNLGAETFRKGKIAHLAARMSGLLRDKQRRGGLGEQGRAWVEMRGRFRAIVKPITFDFRRSSPLEPGLRPKTSFARISRGGELRPLHRKSPNVTGNPKSKSSLNSLQVGAQLRDDLLVLARDQGLVRDLVSFAGRISEQPVEPMAEPVAGRLVLVTSHALSASLKGYGKRTQQMAIGLKERGFDVLCVMQPGQSNEGNTGHKGPRTEKTIDGSVHVQTLWTRSAAPKQANAHLLASVTAYIELFREYKPQVVVAAGDFVSALPAIVAAKQLFLPVIKEYIHYADAFQDEETLSDFSRLNFADKYSVEQACLNMADGSYYLYLEDPDNWDAFLTAIHRVSQDGPCLEPIATLPPKGYLTVESATDGGGLYYLALDVEEEGGGNPKGIVASFRFFDDESKQMKEELQGFSSSRAYPHYQYIDTSQVNSTTKVTAFSIPEGISRIETDVVAFVTSGALTLRKVKLGKVRVEDVASWLTLRVPGIQWIKVVEPYIHKEGATSLRLALLNNKYKLSQHRNELSQLNGAIQEMVELDRTWLPELAYRGSTLRILPTDKLTVAHLHKTAYPYENTGGAIRCLNTALSQQRIGIDPYIITPLGYPRSAGVTGASNHEVIEGIEHFRMGADTDGLRGLSLPDRTRYSAFYLAKLIKARGANVIHAASGVRGYELALQALALKKITGLPLLYEVRSFHEHTWTPVRSDVMDLEKTQLRMIKEDFCMAEADFVTTISLSMKKILIERGVAPEKIDVIPNAIDETKYLGKVFEPMAIPALEGAEFVVGYISNMSRREGHQYLIRSIHQLRQRSGLDIRGLLVGNGPERDNLERLAAALGLADVICFPGEIDHSRINAYYKAIDLFVIPRIPDYAADWVTPLKPYEAMALERLIIVTDLPALREIVGDNEERGLVAMPANVESLVEQMLRYIDDSAMRQSKVNMAKDWVFTERTWTANAKRYDAIYRRLIEQNGTHERKALYA